MTARTVGVVWVFTGVLAVVMGVSLLTVWAFR
jgi:hypothetical protein